MIHPRGIRSRGGNRKKRLREVRKKKKRIHYRLGIRKGGDLPCRKISPRNQYRNDRYRNMRGERNYTEADILREHHLKHDPGRRVKRGKEN